MWHLFIILSHLCFEKQVNLSFILSSWSHQRESLKTMSLLWRCSQAGDWIQTAGYILGRIMLNMNSSGNPWWVCDGVVTIHIILVHSLFEPAYLYSHRCVWWGVKRVITDGCFHIGRTFSPVTWFQYPLKQMGWRIILSFYRYQVFLLTVHSSLECQLWSF